MNFFLELLGDRLNGLEIRECFGYFIEFSYGLLRDPRLRGRRVMKLVDEVEKLLFNRVDLLCKARVLSGLVMVADAYVAFRSRRGVYQLFTVGRFTGCTPV